MISDWTTVFAADAVKDLTLIEEHLAASYASFGESAAEAQAHAAQRIDAIVDAAERIATAPLRGSAHDRILPGLRQLTINRAVYWFTLDEARREIRILAVFFGSQDHQRKMLVRLLGG